MTVHGKIFFPFYVILYYNLSIKLDAFSIIGLQIKDVTDCYKGDVENEEFKEKKRAIEKFSDECVAKVNEICSCQESVEKETTGVPTDNDPLPVSPIPEL